MAKADIESIIREGVEKALNKPVYKGKTITQWAAIGMKMQWVSVDDKLPGLEEEVLIVYEWTGRSGEKYREIALDSFKTMRYLGNKPLFWMPVPEPPNGVDLSIVLLREQEPVKPEHGFPDLKCQNCGTAFVSELAYCLCKPLAEYYKYCPGCGRTVDWNA